MRVVSLTHYGISTYAHGTGTGPEGGLRNDANELLDLMSKLGIALDVTHGSDRSTLEATDRYEGPLLASHQGCRALVPGERQFSDEMLGRVIEREGVIGVPIDTWMLYRPGGGLDPRDAPATEAGSSVRCSRVAHAPPPNRYKTDGI